MNRLNSIAKGALPILLLLMAAGLLFRFPSAGKGQTNPEILVYAPLTHFDLTPTPTATMTPTTTPTTLPTVGISCTPPPVLDPINPDIEDEILEGIQNARDENGRSRLTRVESLVLAARKHSRDMAANNFLDHRGSDGNWGPDRIREQCYFLEEDQEIIWRGTFEDGDDLVALWLTDPAWERAMFDRDVTDFGAGHAVGEVEGEGGNRPETEQLDYLTISFALLESDPTPTPAPGQRIITHCVLSLTNDLGSGTLRLHNASICTDVYYGDNDER